MDDGDIRMVNLNALIVLHKISLVLGKMKEDNGMFLGVILPSIELLLNSLPTQRSKDGTLTLQNFIYTRFFVDNLKIFILRPASEIFPIDAVICAKIPTRTMFVDIIIRLVWIVRRIDSGIDATDNSR